MADLMAESVKFVLALPTKDQLIDDLQNRVEVMRKNARIVCEMLELGDHRLTAMDGPIGKGTKPDLSAEEWGKVYRACRRIAKAGER